MEINTGIAAGQRAAIVQELSGARAWTSVSDYAPAGGEVRQAILGAFRQRGISAPVPQREIRMVGTDAYVGQRRDAA